MDDALEAQLQRLNEDLVGATDEVGAALEAGEDRRQLAAGDAVEALARRYAELRAQVPPGDQERVDRTIGRRMTDLRRAAAQLTKRAGGAAATRAVDAGHVPFLEQRAPRVPQWQPAAAARVVAKYSVGGEVEAWCGKCRGMRDHHIVAMVGGEPKQVLCESCGSRHNFRTTPGRSAGEAGPATPGSTSKRKPTAEDREQERRQEQKRQLQKELAEAEAPREFDPKGRYRAGEIITHPEHGRGKIENVLKGSMLVRFLDGLRPLDLA
jgi:hypothetical protein